MAPSAGLVTEEYSVWTLPDLVHPHTLGRSFYMRPANRPHASDKVCVDNATFWKDVFDERLGAERNVSLKAFNVFDWVPRNPGLFHTSDAAYARDEAQYHVRSMVQRDYNEYFDADGAPPDNAAIFRGATTPSGSPARTLIYTPQGKVAMLRGGGGCVRFKPLHLKAGGTAWLMSATSSSAPDEGIPLLVSDDDYQSIADDLQKVGSVNCDLIGRTRFVSEEFADLFSIQHGIPRLYVEVSELTPRQKILTPGQVSVAASFLSEFEGPPKVYASYVTFDPSRSGARVGAAQWMKEEYVERLYRGSLLTDFDQRAPLFADTLFALDQVMTSPDLASRISKLKSLYGSFDWARLNQFSFIEHQGDLIVTNNTITVTDSTNVVIQSTLDRSMLIADSLQAGDERDRKQLKELLAQLKVELPKTPFEKEEKAQALAEQADLLVKEGAKKSPNKTLLQSFSDGIKGTAGFLKDTVPAVATISAQIISLIGKIHGLPL
jgi:hypothetical protein